MRAAKRFPLVCVTTDIGSHTVLLLLEAGYNVVVADNLINSRYTRTLLKWLYDSSFSPWDLIRSRLIPEVLFRSISLGACPVTTDSTF